MRGQRRETGLAFNLHVVNPLQVPLLRRRSSAIGGVAVPGQVWQAQPRDVRLPRSVLVVVWPVFCFLRVVVGVVVGVWSGQPHSGLSFRLPHRVHSRAPPVQLQQGTRRLGAPHFSETRPQHDGAAHADVHERAAKARVLRRRVVRRQAGVHAVHAKAAVCWHQPQRHRAVAHPRVLHRR